MTRRETSFLALGLTAGAIATGVIATGVMAQGNAGPALLASGRAGGPR